MDELFGDQLVGDTVVDIVDSKSHTGFKQTFVDAWDVIHVLKGWTLRNVAAQGNCAFLSLSWALFGDPTKSRLLRHLLADLLLYDATARLVYPALSASDSKQQILTTIVQEFNHEATKKMLSRAKLVSPPSTYTQAIRLIHLPFFYVPPEFLAPLASLFGIELTVLTSKKRTQSSITHPEKPSPLYLLPSSLPESLELRNIEAGVVHFLPVAGLDFATLFGKLHDFNLKYGRTEIKQVLQEKPPIVVVHSYQHFRFGVKSAVGDKSIGPSLRDKPSPVFSANFERPSEWGYGLLAKDQLTLTSNLLYKVCDSRASY